jgi:ATP-binding cassette subfamily F protein 3
VYGNYDTYELLRANREAAGMYKKEKPSQAATTQREETLSANTKAKRKRKYPYRKAELVEADIAKLESHLKALEEALTTPDIYRDADKVRTTMNEIEASKAKLPQLYEHWEEAMELNG